jgi:tyrosine-protein kinase Etk/Wzc
MEKIEELISNLEKQEKENTRNDYLKFLRRWPWFVLSCLVCLSVCFVLYKKKPETYLVQSRLLIYGQENTKSSELSFEDKRYSEKPGISDQIGILQSYSIFRKAIDNLSWKTTWYKNGIFGKTELYKNEPFDVIVQDGTTNLPNVPIGITALNDKEYLISVNTEIEIQGIKQKVEFSEKGYFGTPFRNDYFNFSLNNRRGEAGEKYSFVFNKENLLTATYQKKVTMAANAKESQVVIIETKGSVPQKEADFLNELNNVFINFGMEKKSLTSESSVSFINTQAEEVKESLRVAEEKLNSYKKMSQMANLGQEANLIYNRLGDTESEKNKIDQQLQYYRNLKNNIGNSEKIAQIGSPPFLSESNDGLNDRVTKLKELYTKREVLSMTVKEISPNYVQLEKEIQMARQGVEETLNNLISTTEQEKQNIDSRYRTVQARMTVLPEAEKNLISLQRDFDVNNELYNFLLKKKAEAAIMQASIAPQAKVIDPAMSEYAIRLGPNLFLYAFAGMFAGLVIPFIIILFLGIFKNKIESVKEIEARLKVPVLNEIIHHKYKAPLPVVDYPQSGITESFRDLKFKLMRKIPEPWQKVISVNSLISGEGKSFISANFAAILSQSDKSVLLVGTDLRNPKLHSFLETREGDGLSDYLKNEMGFDQIINKTSSPNLFFVQAGSVPQNPSELLENSRFEEFIRIARERYDYIVLDNAPLLLVPDANLTTRYSDINLFILRLNYSRVEEISDINKIVENSGVKNAFVVINEAPQKGYKYGSRYWKKGYGNYYKKMRIA